MKSIECSLSNIIIEEHVIIKGNTEEIEESGHVEQGVESILEEKLTVIELENPTFEMKNSQAHIPEVNVYPSAPPITYEPLLSPIKPKNVSYPNLKEMQIQEESTKIEKFRQKSNEIKINLVPFSDNELEDLYFNAQIEQAELFEREFIQSELNVDYYTTNGHLYNLLLLYYKNRRLVKSCELEINELNSSTSNLKTQISTVVSMKNKGEALCYGCNKKHEAEKSFQ